MRSYLFYVGLWATLIAFVSGCSSSTGGSSNATNNQSNSSSNNNPNELGPYSAPFNTPFAWTTFTPSSDTQIVYVSANTPGDCHPYAANDVAIGSDPFHPSATLTHACGTIAAAKNLLRDGYPDWLLLKKGDTWDEALGDWRLSGRSVDERMLIGAYGDGARPFLRTGTGNGIVVPWNYNPNHLAIVGLHMTPHLYTGNEGNPYGVNWLQHTSNLLLEDNYIEKYFTNIVVQAFSNEQNPDPNPRHTNVQIRGNIVVDAYSRHPSSGPYPQGIFAWGNDGLLIEGNVFDHNGWIEGDAGTGPTWYLKNVYIANGNTNVVLRNNIISGTDGAQMRSGGLMENNLFLHNLGTMMLGLGVDPEPNGVSGTIRGNVALDGRDGGDGAGNPLPGGGLMRLGNLTSATIEYNIAAHNINGHAPSMGTFENAGAMGAGSRGVENAVFQHNIYYNWGGTLEFRGNVAQTSNIQFHDNVIENDSSPNTAPLVSHSNADTAAAACVTGSNNKFFRQVAEPWMMIGGTATTLSDWLSMINDTTSQAAQVNFTDPSRDIASYHASIGGGASYEAFLSEARQQSKDNWRSQYTAAAVNEYIRAGFDLVIP